MSVEAGVVVLSIVLVAHMVSTTFAVWVLGRALNRRGAQLKEHRAELDELQKFRSYSLLLMQMEEDKKQMDEMLESKGLPPIWKKPAQ